MTGNLLWALPVFYATLVLPGFIAARRLRAEPLETLLASVLFSCIAAYLLTFSLYVVDLPPAWFGLLAAAGVTGAVVWRREWARLLRAPGVWTCLLPWFVVVIWTLGVLLLLHHYSGGDWYGDWIEHYERTCFFLDHWPLDYRFITLYALPARPPLANLVDGGLMAVTARDYAHFQLANTLFNLLAFLPAAALVREFTKSRPAPWLLALLWILNPMMLQNATYAWTKESAACFVLMGLAFFVRGRRSGEVWRERLAFLALGTGAVCHYSAGIYLVITGLLYLGLEWRSLRHAAGWRRLAGVVAGGAAVLGIWFAWSLARYGFHGTFGTNTTVTGFAGLGPWLHASLHNLAFTLVPQSPWRTADASIFSGTDPMTLVRDYYFMLYQTNLLWAIGSGGWVVVLWLLVRSWRRHRPTNAAGPSPAAWAGWTLVVVLVGTASNPPDPWGVAQVTLQPLVLLALVLLAAGADRLPSLVGWTLAFATLVDFLLGSVLQVAVEHRDYTARWLGGEPYALIAARQNANMRVSVDFKLVHYVNFLGDRIHVPAADLVLLLALLPALVAFHWWQLHRREAGKPIAEPGPG